MAFATSSFRVLLMLAPVGLLPNLVSCSSTMRKEVQGTGGTSSELTSNTTATTGNGGSSGAVSASETSGGGSGGANSTSTGGEFGGTAGSGGGTGGAAGAANATSGGAAGAGSMGGSGGSSGSGGGGGSNFLPMNCAAGDDFCICDDTGCFVDQGGPCTRDDVCESNACGVTQESASLCCASVCATDEVCSADGSGCEAAAVCENEDERCFQGEFERCSGRIWGLVEACGSLGCDVDQGGCLVGAGESCSADADCGEGTCEVTPDGGSVCCTASCGSCKVCDAEGTGCVDPNAVPSGCACTNSDTSNCNDFLSCTDDVCNDGVCANDVVAGFCVIGGQCVSHNAKDPSNPCRYCDATINQQGWTNASSSASCDDGLWCNGTDTCDGSGGCEHQHTSDRCSGNGPCDLGACDEDRDSCYRPSSFACGTRSEDGCSSSACGGDPRTRTNTIYCSGVSSACDGNEELGTWQVASDCAANSVCNATNQSCELKLGCETSWCDPSTGLCWTLVEPEEITMLHSDADAYCENLSLADRRDWDLPTLDQWLEIARGCDGETGTPQTASYISDCSFDAALDEVSNCTPCPQLSGPTEGCYWPSGMGACTTGFFGYWSANAARNAGDFWYYIPWNNGASPGQGNGLPSAVRCVVQE